VSLTFSRIQNRKSTIQNFSLGLAGAVDVHETPS